MTIRPTKTLFISLLCLICFQAGAQKTITFGSDNSDHSKSRSDYQEGLAKNSITLGIASWLNGYVPVYYERAVLPFLSIQAGAGITMRSFSNDFGQLIRNDGEESDFFDNSDYSGFSDVTDKYENYKFREAKSGYYASVAPKIYLGDACMDGFYLAPMFEWKRYNYEAQLANINKTINDYSGSYDFSDDRGIPHVKETVDEYMKCFDFSVNLGGHYQSKKHLAVGWSIALGMRKFSSQRLDIGTELVNNEEFYRNAVRKYDGTRPFFAFNFIIGGCF